MTAQLRRPRHRSRPVRIGNRSRRTVQRSCNGCGRRLGDVTDREIELGVVGMDLPDVRAECPTCTPNPPGLSWEIPLPWTRPPITLNQRGHPKARAKGVRAVRDRAALLAVALHIPPLHALTAELHYVPTDNRTRDPLNLTATLKALEDGLVDANLVPDDNPRYVTSVMPVIDPPERPGRLYLIVRELHPTQEGTT